MLNKLTWKTLLQFLLEQKENGKLQEHSDVMLHNIETGDEYPCDIAEVNGKLVISIDWDKEPDWDLK